MNRMNKKEFVYEILKHVLKNEGVHDIDIIIKEWEKNPIYIHKAGRGTGLVDDRYDKGGLTNYGISSNANKDLGNLKLLPFSIVIEVYYKRYYIGRNLHTFPREYQAMFFDMGIITSPKVSYFIIKNSLAWAKYKVEGHVNSVKLAFYVGFKTHYQRLVDKDETQARFLKGWMNRLQRATGVKDD